MEFSIKKKYKYLVFFSLVLFITFAFRNCSRQNFQTRTFLIGRDSHWYPIQLFGKERVLTPFTNDLIDALATESRLSFDLIDVGYDVLFENLENGYFDGILTFMIPNLENRKKFYFSDPVLKIGPVLIVPAGSNISSLQELEGGSLGILGNVSTIYEVISKHISPKALYTIRTYDSIYKALDDLSSRQLDGVIVDAIEAYTFVETSQKFKIVTAPLDDEGLRLVTRHGGDSQVLVEHFNRALLELRQNGTFAKLLEKWGLFDPDTRFKIPPRIQDTGS